MNYQTSIIELVRSFWNGWTRNKKKTFKPNQACWVHFLFCFIPTEIVQHVIKQGCVSDKWQQRQMYWHIYSGWQRLFDGVDCIPPDGIKSRFTIVGPAGTCTSVVTNDAVVCGLLMEITSKSLIYINVVIRCCIWFPF